MSIRLLDLVLGVDRFGGARTGPLRRLAMVAVADRVGKEDGDSCYPGLADIAARTELGLSTTKRILAELLDKGNACPQHGCWLRKDTRPGFGTVYTLNVARLQAAQRPGVELKRASRLSRPVGSQPVTGHLALAGPSDALSWPLRPSHNRKNRINPSTPLRVVADGAIAKKKRATKPKASDPRHSTVKDMITEAVTRQGSILVWDGAEAGQLGKLLRALPADAASLEFFERCIRSWERSSVNHGERPCKWIGSLPDFQNGPMDRYRNVQASKPTSKPRSAVQKATAA